MTLILLSLFLGLRSACLTGPQLLYLGQSLSFGYQSLHTDYIFATKGVVDMLIRNAYSKSLNGEISFGSLTLA